MTRFSPNFWSFPGGSGAAGLVAAAILAAPVPSPAVLFRVDDPRLTEISGIARGIASPDVFYVQNDSGDSARFFALDATTGRVRAEVHVPGAHNVDWEDIAVARDARGVASVWLADIGDNTAERSEVDIYRVDEPRLAGTRAQPVATGAPDVWRLRYPDGPRDAESLAVASGGAMYVVSKSLTGDSNVYAVPARPDALHVQTMKQIGSIRVAIRTIGTPRQIAEGLTATGAALSSDGSLLAVRTYTDAYLWHVTGGDVAAAIRTQPERLALPEQPQGEGIAIDGNRLVVDSEHVGSAVYAVPLPAGGASPAPSGTLSAQPAPVARKSGHTARTTGIVVGAAVVVAAAGWLAWRRVRRLRAL